MNAPALLTPLANIYLEPWMMTIVIPVVSIILGGAIAISAMYFKHQKELAWHRTAQIALEKGQPLPPMAASDEELKCAPPPAVNTAEWQEAQRGQQRRRDTRSGLIMLAIGVGLYLMLSELTGRNLAMVGAIPGLIGVALLLHGLLDRVFAGKK